MKKTKITHIPHYPTTWWDAEKKEQVTNGTLSHATYDGEPHWKEIRDEEGRWIRHEPVMVENKPWEDELIYDGWYRGRSAAGMKFTNAKGQKFTIFMKDMDIFIPLMVYGRIKSTFIYCKRGANYGVTLYTGDKT